jgi:predicted DNA-binding transcriptional regulator YafY
LRNGVTKGCPNCGRVRPLSEFEDKSLVTGIGKVCIQCKAESKTRKERRKYEARKARKKNDIKIVAKKDHRTIETDYNASVSIKNSALRVALNHHKSLKIFYKRGWRTIDPYALNDTYVVAYCHLRNDLRTFRVDRIEEAVLLKEFSFDKHLQTTAQSGLKQAQNYNWKKEH